jgi:hypothetical protein
MSNILKFFYCKYCGHILNCYVENVVGIQEYECDWHNGVSVNFGVNSQGVIKYITLYNKFNMYMHYHCLSEKLDEMLKNKYRGKLKKYDGTSITIRNNEMYISYLDLSSDYTGETPITLDNSLTPENFYERLKIYSLMQ